MSKRGDKKAWEHAMGVMDDFLSDDEKSRLVLAMLASRESGQATEKELLSLVDWARHVRIEYAMLENVLAGKMVVDMVKGEATFKLTPHGAADAERIAERMGLPVERSDV